MKTAVEWFVKQLPMGVKNSMMGEIEQAKEMEKEQIVTAWMAIDNELQRIAAEQYYNETFKQG